MWSDVGIFFSLFEDHASVIALRFDEQKKIDEGIFKEKDLTIDGMNDFWNINKSTFEWESADKRKKGISVDIREKQFAIAGNFNFYSRHTLFFKAAKNFFTKVLCKRTQNWSIAFFLLLRKKYTNLSLKIWRFSPSRICDLKKFHFPSHLSS